MQFGTRPRRHRLGALWVRFSPERAGEVLCLLLTHLPSPAPTLQTYRPRPRPSGEPSYYHKTFTLHKRSLLTTITRKNLFRHENASLAFVGQGPHTLAGNPAGLLSSSA